MTVKGGKSVNNYVKLVLYLKTSCITIIFVISKNTHSSKYPRHLGKIGEYNSLGPSAWYSFPPKHQLRHSVHQQPFSPFLGHHQCWKASSRRGVHRRTWTGACGHRFLPWFLLLDTCILCHRIARRFRNPKK